MKKFRFACDRDIEHGNCEEHKETDRSSRVYIEENYEEQEDTVLCDHSCVFGELSKWSSTTNENKRISQYSACTQGPTNGYCISVYIGHNCRWFLMLLATDMMYGRCHVIH